MSTSGLNCYLWKYPAVANVQVHVYFCLHNKIFYLWTFSIKLPKAGRIIFIGYPHNQAQPWHKQQRKKLKSLCIFSPFAAKTWEVLWWPKKSSKLVFRESHSPSLRRPTIRRRSFSLHPPPLLFKSHRSSDPNPKGKFPRMEKERESDNGPKEKVNCKMGRRRRRCRNSLFVYRCSFVLDNNHSCILLLHIYSTIRS